MAVQGLGDKVSGASVLLMVEKEGTFIPVGGQTGATINRNSETIDVTNKVSEGYKEYVGGWKDWSVDSDAFVTLGDEGQTLLEEAFADGVAITVNLRIGADANAKGVTYTGKALITSLTTDLSQDNAVTYSLSLQGTGKLARVVGAKTSTKASK